jgi:hypothetical protein
MRPQPIPEPLPLGASPRYANDRGAALGQFIVITGSHAGRSRYDVELRVVERLIVDHSVGGVLEVELAVVVDVLVEGFVFPVVELPVVAWHEPRPR